MILSPRLIIMPFTHLAFIVITVLDCDEAFAILRDGRRIGTIYKRGLVYEIRDKDFNSETFVSDLQTAKAYCGERWPRLENPGLTG